MAGSGAPAADPERDGLANSIEFTLGLDPTLAEAHASLGWIHANFDWDWAAAEREYAARVGMRAVITLPLAIAGRTWCAVSTGDFSKPREWTPIDANRLRIIGEVNIRIMQNLLAKILVGGLHPDFQ